MHPDRAERVAPALEHGPEQRVEVERRLAELARRDRRAGARQVIVDRRRVDRPLRLALADTVANGSIVPVRAQPGRDRWCPCASAAGRPPPCCRRSRRTRGCRLRGGRGPSRPRRSSTGAGPVELEREERGPGRRRAGEREVQERPAGRLVDGRPGVEDVRLPGVTPPVIVSNVQCAGSPSFVPPANCVSFALSSGLWPTRPAPAARPSR